MHNINYGTRLWNKIYKLVHMDEDLISALIQLALNLDEHMNNIIELCLIYNNTLNLTTQIPAQQIKRLISILL
jgi:hypothetical protein